MRHRFSRRNRLEIPLQLSTNSTNPSASTSASASLGLELFDIAIALVEDSASSARSAASSFGEVVHSMRRRAHSIFVDPLIGTNVVGVAALATLTAMVVALVLISYFSGGTRLQRQQSYDSDEEEEVPQPRNSAVKSALSSGQPRQGRVVSFQPVSEISVDSLDSADGPRSFARPACLSGAGSRPDTPGSGMVSTGSYLTVNRAMMGRSVSAGLASEVSGSDIFNIFGADPPRLDEELAFTAGHMLTRDQVQDIVLHAHGFDTAMDGDVF